MGITIWVKAEHINGRKFISNVECPIAVAVSEATGRKCFVGTTELSFVGGPYGVSLPKEATDFQWRGLEGERVEPFVFDLNI